MIPKEEITHGEKLIAGFMGKKKRYESTEDIFIKNLKYHTSWDWIMPACKKWDELGSFDEATAAYEQLCDELDEAVSRYDIEAVFQQLIKNITCYNATEKTQK